MMLYFDLRKVELSKFATNLTVLKTNIKTTETGISLDATAFGNLGPNSVAMYEYTYDFAGVKYHTYQLFGLTATDGYVFTYTAREADFATHFDEVMTVVRKVKF